MFTAMYAHMVLTPTSMTKSDLPSHLPTQERPTGTGAKTISNKRRQELFSSLSQWSMMTRGVLRFSRLWHATLAGTASINAQVNDIFVMHQLQMAGASRLGSTIRQNCATSRNV